MTVTNNEDEQTFSELQAEKRRKFRPVAQQILNGLPGNKSNKDELHDLYQRCDVSNNRTDNPVGFEEFKSALQTLITKSVVAELKAIKSGKPMSWGEAYAALDKRIAELKQSLNRKEG